MTTFTPEELPALVALLQFQRTPGQRGATLACDHSAAGSTPAEKVAAQLPPIDDDTYYAMWVETFLTCSTCWRPTQVDVMLGELPTGRPLGYPLIDERLPSLEDVVTACVRDALSQYDGTGPGWKTYGAEHVAARSVSDADLVASLRSDVEKVLTSYGERLRLWVP